jgi:hypothetical protein
MNIKEIMKKYLKDNGYGGLRHSETNCSCAIESSENDLSDLFECGEYCGDCEPAYTKLCERIDGDCDHCEADEDNKICYTTENPKSEVKND